MGISDKSKLVTIRKFFHIPVSIFVNISVFLSFIKYWIDVSSKQLKTIVSCNHVSVCSPVGNIYFLILVF